MKNIVISPKKGTVRISHFTARTFDLEPVRSTTLEKRNVSSERELINDLQRRRTAPLELSAALRARLPFARCISLAEECDN